MDVTNEVLSVKRDYIRKKAMNIFLYQVHGSVSINNICKEISISKKTFYKYYSSKDELLLEIDQKILKEIFIPEFQDSGILSNNYEKFSKLIKKFVNLAFEKPEYYRFFYMNFTFIKNLLAKLEFNHYQDFRNDYLKIFTSAYDEGLKDGSIKIIKAFSCMNILRSLNGLLLYILTELENNEEAKSRSHEEIFSFVDHALEIIKK